MTYEKSHSKIKKTLKPAEYPEMEEKLYEWIRVQRKSNKSISYQILTEKAKYFYQKCYQNNHFSASKGWIVNFKKRHNLQLLKVREKMLSQDEDTLKTFKKHLIEKIKNMDLKSSQIYRADVSGLFWKNLPSKLITKQNENISFTRDTINERLTFLVCSNTDGSHKLQLFVVGKEQNSRSFSNNLNIPIEYETSKNTLMTWPLLKNWFHNSFVIQVSTFLKENNLSQKSLLLLDNALSHTSQELISEDNNFVTLFLPSDCTTLIQHVTKLHYKKSLLVNILSLSEANISARLKSITLKDAIRLLADAWNKISRDTVRTCWLKLQFENCGNKNSIATLSKQNQKILNTNRNMQDLSLLLNNLIGVIMTEDEIKKWIEDDCIITKIEDDEDEEENIKREMSTLLRIKHDDACKTFNIAIQWAEENHVSFDKIVVLQELKERACLLNLENTK